VEKFPAINDFGKRLNEFIAERLIAAVHVKQWDGWEVLSGSLHRGRP